MSTMSSIATKRRRRVLVIDDEPSMTEWLRIVIEAEGYEVRSALIGARGEEIFRQWRPDVVLTDIELPDTDGIALLHRLKEIDEAPQVIVVGAQGGVARAVEAGQAGAFYYLEKPVDQSRPDPHPAQGGRANPRARRAPSPEGAGARPLQLRQRHRPEQEDEGSLRAHRERGGQRRQHPDSGRERHRQRAHCQRHPSQLEPGARAVHQDQLRRHSQRADRERALRVSQGRVHRARPPTRSACSKWRRAGRCCSTRLARCRRISRRSCCACSRSASTVRSAATGSSGWTSG